MVSLMDWFVSESRAGWDGIPSGVCKGRGSINKLETLWIACDKVERNRERRGYFDAFEKLGVNLRFLGDPETMKDFRACITLPGRKFLLFPDPPSSIIPNWLPHDNVVSASFQIDSFVKPQWKALWSTLFDFVFIFHPDPENVYSWDKRGGVFVLPHAVDLSRYQGMNRDRVYDVGWVGSLLGEHNRSRRELLPQLAKEFSINDFEKFYEENEVPEVYGSSKIVVNVSRDDHPGDANTRCFEAMAAGALLVTRLPSELQSLGFVDGVHFIGYRDQSEVAGLVRRLLVDESSRINIANNGRTLVLSHHNYYVRAAKIVQVFSSADERLLAPGRKLSHGDLAFTYCHYYAKKGLLRSALKQLAPTAAGAPTKLPHAILVIARCAWHIAKKFLVGRMRKWV